jgi:3-oxoadipyl-CoA thiolase
MREVVIVDAVRTPIGRYKGVFKEIRSDDLGASVLRALVERNPGLPLEEIEDVIMGCANQSGEDNRNVARMSLLLAGLPLEIGGTTVNRLCGSGLDAINLAARSILAGEGDIYIAGGTESMTRAPFVMAKPETDYPRGNQTLLDTTIGWRFINPKLAEQYGTLSMPETAEEVATRFKITREEQDLFAYESQKKYSKAYEQGNFNEEVVPIILTDRKGNQLVIAQDEHPRPQTSLEKLSALRPLFEDGTVTAGNSSGINDGASALILMSKEKAIALEMSILGTYVTSATAGLEPNIMGVGPIPATTKALKRAGLVVGQLDVIELNEAFAAQALACLKGLHLPKDKVNMNGGAIALGHPLGASGARIMTTLLYQMKRQKARYGLATMCIGVGQGISTIIKREEI